MITSFDIENLNAFLKNFYTAVGVRISVFDDEFNLVTEYPVQSPRYCALIRQSDSGKTGCKHCDIAAFKEARKRRGSYIYTCHAGLTEAVTPIKLGGGILGYVILAHMLPKERYDESLKNALQKATDYGVKETDAMSALKEIKARSNEKIDAYVQLLNAVAAYLHVNDWVKWKTEDVANRISEYIELNLDEPLDGNTLCKKFLISRTKLYTIAMESYGMSITRYILSKRIEKAKELLGQRRSVVETSEKTGFSNANYFSKVFKKETGISPTEYKRSL